MRAFRIVKVHAELSAGSKLARDALIFRDLWSTSAFSRQPENRKCRTNFNPQPPLFPFPSPLQMNTSRDGHSSSPKFFPLF
ncbi:hypothetical protein TcWFU_000776 [Taenia crassiceps]|uniref:Uncharacterized protein n=1 Tax=Taenia crassiceps TaxID=6207 RepID=A0ABR4QAG1_9CEST